MNCPLCGHPGRSGLSRMSPVREREARGRRREIPQRVEEQERTGCGAGCAHSERTSLGEEGERTERLHGLRKAIL